MKTKFLREITTTSAFLRFFFLPPESSVTSSPSFEVRFLDSNRRSQQVKQVKKIAAKAEKYEKFLVQGYFLSDFWKTVLKLPSVTFGHIGYL